jgi:hypothetical protein
MLSPCPHEKELTALALHGQWPDAAPAELRVHVEKCRACGDIALLMQAFRSARAESMSMVQPGSAGVLWWRAQLRRRRAAMQRIERPLLGAQIFALVVTLVIAGVFAATELRPGSSFASLFSQLARAVTASLQNLWASAAQLPLWGLALGVSGLIAVALLSGLMLYTDRQQR